MGDVEDRSAATTVRHAATTAAERPPRGDASPLDEPRRGRKKRQTRDALIDAAFDLFEAKGYEHTAVHEITDAVDVAERTFFRYFASKEDLVLFFVKQQMDGFADALDARPEGEAPFSAVRNAFRQTLEQLQGDGYERSGEARYLAVVRLIDSTPALLAASLHYVYDNSDRAVDALAKRENVDPDVDRRPWLLIAIYGTLMALAHREWRAYGCGGAEGILVEFDAYADQLGPTIAGHWGASDD
jgi:AcrR family transcriptional regulator